MVVGSQLYPQISTPFGAAGIPADKYAAASQSNDEIVINLLLPAGVSPALVTYSGTAKSRYMDGRLEAVVHSLISS